MADRAQQFAAQARAATQVQHGHRLRATYCGKIGVEFMHIQDPEQKAWIQARIEGTAGGKTHFRR